MKLSNAILAITVALSGCGASHVQLAPVTPQLTPAERVGKFHALRPVKEGTFSENGTKVDNWLVLADKTEVGFPEDLAPVLDENSETMRVARQSAAMRKRKEATGIASSLFTLGGVVLAAVSIETTTSVPGQPWTSLTMIGVGIITGIFAHHYKDEELDLRRKAFSTYPRDLGAKLNVCAHGLEVVACDAPLPAPPVPTAAPQQP